MKQIKNIIFDFGGVLVEWNPRYFYRTYFKTEEEMEYFLGNVCTTEWNTMQDAGRPLEEGVRLMIEQHPEYQDAIEHYYAEWETMLHSDIPETAELLREVKAAGYGVYGLTNWSAETIGSAFRRYDFFKLFEGIVISGVEKLIKPDHRIYRLLLERYGLTAEECVFIDDNPANIAAAEELGIRGILFTDAASARAQLQELGVL